MHIIRVKPSSCHTWLVKEAHVWTKCDLVESCDKMTKICHIFNTWSWPLYLSVICWRKDKYEAILCLMALMNNISTCVVIYSTIPSAAIGYPFDPGRGVYVPQGERRHVQSQIVREPPGQVGALLQTSTEQTGQIRGSLWTAPLRWHCKSQCLIFYPLHHRILHYSTKPWNVIMQRFKRVYEDWIQTLV